MGQESQKETEKKKRRSAKVTAERGMLGNGDPEGEGAGAG